MPTTKRNSRKSTKRTTRRPATRSAKRTVESSHNSSSHKSPYASAFNTAIKRGTPCSVVVNGIAQRTKKSPKQIFESLFKAGHVYRQKFNGQWVYWPSQKPRTNKTNAKQAQIDAWQNFIDWCFCNGFCTPEQMSNPSSQNEFMSYCRKFWNRQFSGTSTSSKSTSRKRTARKSSSRKSTTTRAKRRSTSRSSKPRTSVRRKSNSRSGRPASFKFPTASRRIRKAA